MGKFNKQGKLIVIEGSDGSGKATQTKKLFDRLSDLESKVKRLSFPNYESESSAIIRMYLRGDFRQIRQLFRLERFLQERRNRFE